jgi:hypothetical protein
VAPSQASTIGEEAGAARRGLVDRGVAAVAVVAHGRAVDQHRRAAGGAEDAGDDRLGGADAARADLPLAGLRPPPVAHAGTGEVHHRIEPVHLARLLGAPETNDGMPAGGEEVAEGIADEAVRAGDADG